MSTPSTPAASTAVGTGDGSPLGLGLARLGLVAVVAVAYVVLVPVLLGDHPYWLNVLTNASVLSFASLGVWVTFSIGRVNIAQGAFAMIGGYTTAILSTRYGLPGGSACRSRHCVRGRRQRHRLADPAPARASISR